MFECCITAEKHRRAKPSPCCTQDWNLLAFSLHARLLCGGMRHSGGGSRHCFRPVPAKIRGSRDCRLALRQSLPLHAALAPSQNISVSVCIISSLPCLCSPPERMWWWEDTMADYSYILFNKTPSQLRLLGACGGRAYGRNRGKRLAQMPTAPAAIPSRVKPGETTAKAIARLDAQFPWLRQANRPRR